TKAPGESVDILDAAAYRVEELGAGLPDVSARAIAQHDARLSPLLEVPAAVAVVTTSRTLDARDASHHALAIHVHHIRFREVERGTIGGHVDLTGYLRVAADGVQRVQHPLAAVLRHQMRLARLTRLGDAIQVVQRRPDTEHVGRNADFRAFRGGRHRIIQRGHAHPFLRRDRSLGFAVGHDQVHDHVAWVVVFPGTGHLARTANT